MVAVDVVMVPLSKALALSLIIERAIEFGKNFVEPAFGAPDTRALPDSDQARKAVDTVVTVVQRDAARQAVEQAAGQDERLADRATLSAQLQQVRDRLVNETDSGTRAVLLQQAAKLKGDLAADERNGEWDESVPPSGVVVGPATDPDRRWALPGF